MTNKSEQTGLFKRLREGIRKTQARLGSVFKRGSNEADLLEELEEALFESDVGESITTRLVEDVRSREKGVEPQQALERALVRIFEEGAPSRPELFERSEAGPRVWLILRTRGCCCS